MKRIFEIEWPDEYGQAWGDANDAGLAFTKDITSRIARVQRRWLLVAYLGGGALALIAKPLFYGGFLALAVGLYLWHLADRNGWGR